MTIVPFVLTNALKYFIVCRILINYVTGTHYNPQDQATVEWHHQIFKWQILKIERGYIHAPKSLHTGLHIAMLSLIVFCCLKAFFLNEVQPKVHVK